MVKYKLVSHIAEGPRNVLSVESLSTAAQLYKKIAFEKTCNGWMAVTALKIMGNAVIWWAIHYFLLVVCCNARITTEIKCFN